MITLKYYTSWDEKRNLKSRMDFTFNNWGELRKHLKRTLNINIKETLKTNEQESDQYKTFIINFNDLRNSFLSIEFIEKDVSQIANKRLIKTSK